MRTATTIFTITFALLLSAPHADAQSLKKGTLSGVLSSASATVPNAGSVNLLTTPANEFFILTQYCAEDPGGVILSGNTMGNIVPGPDECTSYDPGIAIPLNETLSLTDDGGGEQDALINGVVSKK